VDKPNIYSFDTSYETIFKDLKNKDQHFYTQNGLLNMLDRNRRIKEKPERFQDCKNEFDIIVTCQERVFDQVLEYMAGRDGMMMRPVHIINVEIKDNHEEATLGAFLIYELVDKICTTEDPETEIDDVIEKLEQKKRQRFLHTIAFYWSMNISLFYGVQIEKHYAFQCFFQKPLKVNILSGTIACWPLTGSIYNFWTFLMRAECF